MGLIVSGPGIREGLIYGKSSKKGPGNTLEICKMHLQSCQVRANDRLNASMRDLLCSAVSNDSLSMGFKLLDL